MIIRISIIWRTIRTDNRDLKNFIITIEYYIYERPVVESSGLLLWLKGDWVLPGKWKNQFFRCLQVFGQIVF
jgi:hypothetical protein